MDRAPRTTATPVQTSPPLTGRQEPIAGRPRRGRGCRREVAPGPSPRATGVRENSPGIHATDGVGPATVRSGDDCQQPRSAHWYRAESLAKLLQRSRPTQAIVFARVLASTLRMPDLGKNPHAPDGTPVDEAHLPVVEVHLPWPCSTAGSMISIDDAGVARCGRRESGTASAALDHHGSA